MIKGYASELYERSGRPIDNLDGWLWIKGDGGPGSDGGAWTGPREDWINSHSEKFFKYVKNFGTVIQAGGNLGLYPRLLANRFEIVYTFEPDPLNFHCLVNNCQLDNVVKIQGALGEKNEFIKILRNQRSNVGMHRVVVDETGCVPVFSIDSFNFTRCDMIMLDTEGYENPILKGAVQTIEKFRPVITAENNNKSDLLDIIGTFGYKAVDKSVADTIFVAE